LEQAIGAVVAEGPTALVIDLSAVDFEIDVFQHVQVAEVLVDSRH